MSVHVSPRTIGSVIAERIALRLTCLGKSQAETSLAAGLGRSAVQNILTGSSESPRIDTLLALCGALDCNLSYLIGQDEDLGDPIHGTSPSTPVREQDKFMLRLPDGMRDALKAEAERNNRSLNAEIVWRLRNVCQPKPAAASENSYSLDAFSMSELHGDLTTITGLLNALVLMGQAMDSEKGEAVIAVAEQAKLSAKNSYDVVVNAMEAQS